MTTKTAEQWMTKKHKMRNSLHIGKSAYLQHKADIFSISDKGKITTIPANTPISLTHNENNSRSYEVGSLTPTVLSSSTTTNVRALDFDR